MTQSTKQMETAIAIRRIDSFSEMDACVQLQQSVWQFTDLNMIPRRMFVVARAVGGQIFGAWDEEKLAGYALAIPGIRNGRPYLHSHMLAVSPEYRNRHIGTKLKLAQRSDALARGIELIEWTFDPLQIKNAHLNVEKLGVIVRRYTPDFYGHSDSPLHGSLPTDRLHAEWWLRSKRVESILAGQPAPGYAVKVTVAVPNHEQARETESNRGRDSALESLLQVRRWLLEAFANGLAVLGFQSIPGREACYLLGQLDAEEPGYKFRQGEDSQ